MQIVNLEAVKNKKVLLRLDIDVPLQELEGENEQLLGDKLQTTGKKIFKVTEDYRLKAGLETLKLCLDSASEVIIVGHIGRPEGKKVSELSVEPIYDWLVEQGYKEDLESDKLRLLENIRFEKGEESGDLKYAKELASLGEVFVNEAFASHHPAASTTVLPTLLPSFAGLHFAKEVEMLTKVRNNPIHPMVAIVGGVKVEDKKPALLSLSKVADQVLVGGKIADELRSGPKDLFPNVYLGKNNQLGIDLTKETTKGWSKIISLAKMVVWNGPLGQVQNDRIDERNNGDKGSEEGSFDIAQAIIHSEAESIIGGGDTISLLGKYGLLDKFSFVSTGGGAMLKFLAEGTLPTIEALK